MLALALEPADCHSLFPQLPLGGYRSFGENARGVGGMIVEHHGPRHALKGRERLPRR